MAAAATQALRPVRWVHIPHQVPYMLGLALQEKVVARRLAAKQFLDSQPGPSPSSARVTEDGNVRQARQVAEQDYLFLLEHTPVYTEGRRKGAKEAIADDAEGKRLSALGADYILAQRGGLITFHGPGQIVGYPIWDIGRMNNLSTRCYVDKMQTVFRRLLEDRFSIGTVPPPDEHTGVWADEDHKILSIGIQVRQRITSHGFALNVAAQPLLSWFGHIVACGIKGKAMTSIERELAIRVKGQAGGASAGTEIEPGLFSGPQSRVTVEQVAPLVAHQFGQTYGREIEPVGEGDVQFKADPQTNILERVWFAGEEVHPLKAI